MRDEFPITLDHSAKLRLRLISKELGRDVYDLIRISAEEAAMEYFRHRPQDDPAGKMV
jgi:hypothetical protein